MATIKVAGVDRSTYYSKTELDSIEMRFVATDGEPGQGSAPIPDPTGAQTPYAGQSFQVIAPGPTTVFDGFVGPLQRERGEGATGDRRLDTYTIGDENAVLHGFRAYRWVRPSESTRTRFLAFLAAFVPWVTDTTWVTSAVTATMAAKTYTTETLFDELFTEIKDLTGNTAFVENHRAHLHPPTAGIAAGIAFSDTAYDFVTAFPIFRPRRSKDPIDLRDDVMVTTPGGNATATDGTALARYSAAGVQHQALVQLDTGTAAIAAAKAAAILADSKAERIMYEFDAGLLTAAQVAQIPVGSLINLTSAVMGLSSSTQRIAGLTLKYRHPDVYDVHIECGFPVRIRKNPPRTTNPVADMTAQAQLQNCGSPITLFGKYQGTRVGLNGALSWAASAGPRAGSSLQNNISWPFSPCSVGIGAWDTPIDEYAAFSFTAPADSDQIDAVVTVDFYVDSGSGGVCPGRGHPPIGTQCGPIYDIFGYSIIVGLGAGGTPTAGDLVAGAAAGSVGSNGPSAANAGAQSFGIPVPRSGISFGSSGRVVVAPTFHVTREYACNDDVLGGPGVGDGVARVDLTSVQMRCLVPGTYGWITAAPREAPDGARTAFTLIGGYSMVESVALNGITVPASDWTATDGSTLTTIGWSPKSTDIMLARYYIPK